MDITDKRILVTGGHGFVGTFVVKGLRERGVPAERISTPAFEEFDLRRPEHCASAVRGAEVVIHLAGITGGVEFHRANPGSIFYDNLLTGVNMIEAARLSGVGKFVTIGSAAEYPWNAPMPLKEEDLWNGPPDPIHGPYAFAKRALLVHGQAYRAQYGMHIIHLLPASMYGPHERDDFVIPALIDRFRNAIQKGISFVEVWGSGKPTRDFLYIEDAAEGILLATEKYDKPEPVNLSSGREISIGDLASLIAREMDFRGEIRFNTEKPDGQMRRPVDASRAAREFGFRAKTDFETGLKKTIAWHLSR